MGLVYLYGDEDHKVTKITDRIKRLYLNINNTSYMIIITAQNIKKSKIIEDVYFDAIKAVQEDYKGKSPDIQDIFEKITFYTGGLLRARNITLISVRVYEVEKENK